MHPADFKRLNKDERFVAVINGWIDPRVHWKVTRVAELCGLNPEDLHWHVEVQRGWEPHDKGFLHQVIVSAGILLGRQAGP